MSKYAIGVDLGGTNMRAAAVSFEGEILEKISVPTDAHLGNDAVVGRIVEAVNQIREGHDSDHLLGIGVGVPGFILMEEGLITDSPNLPYMKDFPMRDILRDKLQAEVLRENDANAAALGEKWIGAGKDVNDLVLLTLGTGVGGGIIINGRVHHGFMGMAGELGHTTVNPTGNPCGCGNVGCLEKHASATAVRVMSEMLFPGEDYTPQQLDDLCEDGNHKALMIYDRVGEALGISIANFVNIFNFPLYLLSGGLLPAWRFFAPRMMEEVNRRSFVFRNTPTRVEKATLGNMAGLFGAAHLPMIR
jgi:glucokinase